MGLPSVFLPLVAALVTLSSSFPVAAGSGELFLLLTLPDLASEVCLNASWLGVVLVFPNFRCSRSFG